VPLHCNETALHTFRVKRWGAPKGVWGRKKRGPSVLAKMAGRKSLQNLQDSEGKEGGVAGWLKD